MRTAADFNSFYATPDPWKIGKSSFRDRVYRRFLPHAVRGKHVLELGCGEGCMTETLFDEAASVIGVDISNVAIERAKRKNLRNAKFETGDFIGRSFKGFDVIAALECIYYLSPDEQEAFFVKVAREHRGKTLLLSGPIIGQGEHRCYFTHTGLMETFARHRMTVIAQRNISINRRGPLITAAAIAARIAPTIMDVLPERAIFQRCYMIRIM